MNFFDNISYIRQNSGLGVAQLAKTLSVPTDDLKDFMVVNDIKVV
jgi:DNA-binding transcriptional regulator YiaG